MSRIRPTMVHLSVALPLAFLSVFAITSSSAGDPNASISLLSNLFEHLFDGRTRRYVLCLAIPLVGLPVLTATWCSGGVLRTDWRGMSDVVGKALICGIGATLVFSVALEVALATAASRPGPASRFTIRHAWMAALIWSLLYVPIACLSHVAAARLIGCRR